jgi:hypothetical protein
MLSFDASKKIPAFADSCCGRYPVPSLMGDKGMDHTELAPESLPFLKWDLWSKWVLFLLVGYALVGRSFSYIGIPPAKLFIGDLTLAAFIFLRPRKIFDPWILAITKGGPVSAFAWMLLISIAYGIFEVIRGVLLGFSPLYALQNLVFNVYPLFFFLGLWVGARRPELLLRYVQTFAVCLAIYAPLYMIVLDKVWILMPGSDGVPVFGQTGGGGLVILGLICLDSKPARWWPAMVVAAAIFLAAQVRAEWLGTGVAILLWGVLSRKMSRVAMIAVGIFMVLAVGAILDVNIPAPSERGGAISSQEIVARGLAAVSPDLARDVTGSDNVTFYKGTITWRERWWKAIWQNSNDTYTNQFIGPGYGFVLRNLVNYHGDVRTPHNIFYYALGYSGWIGVVIFFALQATCVSMLWRAYRLTGQAFGLSLWVATLIEAFFGNVMETPTGAIPLYLIIGIIVGPTLGKVSRTEQLEHHYAADQSYESELAYTTE